MEQDIKPGDLVLLLGNNPFLVLEVHAWRGLHVRDQNGNTWWARRDGAKVMSRVQDRA